MKTGRGARNDKATSATVAEVAEELGVPYRTAARRASDADDFETLSQGAQDDVSDGVTTLQEAKAEQRKKKAAEERIQRCAGEAVLR